MVLDEKQLLELVLSIVGEEGRRRVENRGKSNDELFAGYINKVKASLSTSYARGIESLLGKFKEFLKGRPLEVDLVTAFLAQYSQHSQNTRARYYYMIQAFYRWFCGEVLPFKVKQPKLLPTIVSDEDVATVIATMSAKRSHKGTLERDLMIIWLAENTGLRRGEMASLKVGDLVLNVARPMLLVRGGKGARDRQVPLNPYITEKLKHLVRGKEPNDRVLGISEKWITNKVGNWARKAGVPHLTPHALRHKFANDLVNRGVKLSVVQDLLGHESLDTTRIYLTVTDKDKEDAVDRLCKPVPEIPIGGYAPGTGKELEAGGRFSITPADYDIYSDIITPLTYGFFSIDLESSHILLSVLRVRTDDPALSYKVMLFEGRPDNDSYEHEDLIQMEAVQQRIYQFAPERPLEIANREGEARLWFGLGVYQRNIPVDMLSPDRAGERSQLYKKPVNFEVSVQYR